VDQIIDVVLDPVLGNKKCLYMPPGSLDRVRMSASTLINRTDRVNHSLVCVTLRFNVPVCQPAVTCDFSAGFDPVSNNSLRGVGISVRNGNWKWFSGLALNTTEHSLPVHFVSPIVFALAELAVVDFDGLVRTTDFLRATQHIF